MNDDRPLARWRSLSRFLFGFSEPVSRRPYVIAGFALGALKMAVDLALLLTWSGGRPAGPWLPYLAPFRVFHATPGAEWLQLILVLWSLPFLWIGVSLTVRRAVDAGASPWLGVLFFVPYVNWILMLALCLLPTRGASSWRPAADGPARRRPLWAWLLIVLFASGVGLGLALLHLIALRRYGAALFFGIPFATGALAGFLANHDAPRSLRTTLLLAFACEIAIGLGLIAVALEGLVCVLMALPIALILAGLGAVLGREIARRRPESPALAGCLLILVPLSDAARPAAPPELAVVTTCIDIAAPPEVVWRHVVSFAALPPPDEWLFRMGVAYPVRARIDGRGVGAVRRCEFSTGAFVEPITAWEEPRRLAFDVASSPIPMEEWSPWRTVYAAHLHSGFRSQRGEFRLIALCGSRTRLEGRTWYALDIHPCWYWNLYAGAIVHTIHLRVLRHVRSLAEAEAEAKRTIANLVSAP